MPTFTGARLVIGLDPGYKESAFVLFNGVSILEHKILDNDAMMLRLVEDSDHSEFRKATLVVEQISMGGMIAGAEVFETCFWSGRFVQLWAPRRWDRIKRSNVKLHLCGRMHAKDANVRAALIERFGPTTEAAIGNKKHPGPLIGITSHQWAALAVAVAWYDVNGHKPEEIRPGVQPEFQEP